MKKLHLLTAVLIFLAIISFGLGVLGVLYQPGCIVTCESPISRILYLLAGIGAALFFTFLALVSIYVIDAPYDPPGTTPKSK